MIEEPQKIFVVDDDAAVRHSVRALLEAYGYEVEDFASGDEFLDHYRPQMRGCVVLDVNMPGRADGFSVLRRIGHRAELPVLMATGRADAAVAARVAAAGAAFLEKPFHGEGLIDHVRRMMPVH